MIRTRSISTLSLAMLLVACSESSVEPRYAKQFDEVCVITADAYCPPVRSTLSTYPKSLSLTSGPQVLVVVISKDVFPSGIPNGAKLTVGGVAPSSDTIPGPLPPGPGQQLLHTVAGRTQFAAALHDMFAAGLVSGSDTIPAPLPGPPAPLQYLGSVATRTSTGNYLIVLNSADLQKRGIISPESGALQINVVKGNNVLYSGLATFGIISPEKGD